MKISNNKTVLIIDDEEANIHAMRLWLSEKGFDVIKATEGFEALRLIEEHFVFHKAIDIVIADIMMPGIDGIRLLAAIKNKWPHIPVIMLTALQDRKTKQKCYDSCADEFISKPCDMDDFLRKIYRTLEKSELQNKMKEISENYEQTIKRLLREKKLLENRLFKVEEEMSASINAYKQAPEESGSGDQFINKVGELIRPIVHDIKQPVVVLSMYLDEIRIICETDEKKSDKVSKVLKKAIEQIGYLNVLIDDLRFLGSHLSEVISVVNVNDLIKRLVKQSQGRFKNVKINLNLAKDFPRIEADKMSLEQLIKNLLINAMEACNAISGPISVTTKVNEDPRYISIIISDKGLGIHPSVKDKIYDLHFTTKRTGFGIGLYLAKKAVELHNGTILCESMPGQGTTFTITLPMARKER